MHQMTAGNLRNAHGGESMAHMRYMIWGEKAHREGLENVARLFRAISAAEQVHATNHFAALSKVDGAYLCNSMAEFGNGDTAQNLAGAIDGELFEIREMYPSYLQAAEFQDEKPAVRSFHYALEAEKIHAEMFTRAKEVVEQGKDIDLGPVQICNVCGWTGEGEIPDRCPICNATKKAFWTFE